MALEIKKIVTMPIKNNPVLIIVVVFFLLLSLGNRIYNNYTTSFHIHERINKVFPACSIEEKERWQKRIIEKTKHLDVKVYIHVVKMGENYWQIARENGLDIDTIVGLNPYLKNLYASAGENLLVANRKGCLHIIQGHETLYDLANLYDVSVSEIRRANRLNIFVEYIYGLNKNDVLFIPDVKPVVLTEGMNEMYELRRALQSPLGGAYTSGFGLRIDPITRQSRHHNGLDIRVRIGTAVGASADGVVVAAGWAGGYGKMIKVSHYNGYTTLYGHLSRIYVRTGQKVKQGQIIGSSGNTGRTTGPHLHFTVWYKGKLVNPAKFLW